MPWWKFWEEEPAERERPDYYAEGVALARQQRHHEALTSFRLALRERPEDPAVLEQMAVVYTQIGVTEEAMKLYRRALSLQESAAAHYGLAFLLLRRGEADAAERHLRAFLASAPADSEMARHVEHARETLERLERAERAGDPEASSAPDPEGPRDGGD